MPREPSTYQDVRLLRSLDLVGLTFFGSFSGALLIACWADIRWPVFLGPEFIAVCVAMMMLVHAVLVSSRASAVDPIIWIPLALLAFYFGMPFARFLGATISYEAWLVQPPRNLARGFGVALLSLTSFLAGIYLHGVEDRRQPQRVAWSDDRFLEWAGLAVLGIGFIFILIGFVKTGPSLILGMYGELYESKAMGTDVRLFDAGLIFSKAGVIGILVAHRPQRSAWTWFALATTTILVVFSARLGDRGGLISFVCATAWIYSQRIRRIPASRVVVAAVLAVFVLPGIKEYRETRSLQATLSLNPIEATASTLFEAGSSALTIVYTLDLIPAEKSYGWGVSYVRAFAHLIPNIGLTPGKSFLPAILDSSPSHWLTERLNPIKYEQGGGYGYSSCAELYFNFGLAGVLAGMVLNGYMLCFFRSRQFRGPLWLVWSALFFSMSTLIVRNILGAPLKAAIWSFVALWALSSFVRVLKRSNPMRLADQVSDDGSGNVV